MLAFLFGAAAVAACSSSGSSAAPAPAASGTPSQLVYVSSTNGTAMQVSAFPTGAGGNIAPVKTIGGSQTQLDDPQSIVFDAAGNLYVVNAGANPGTSGMLDPSITVYAKGSSGNVAPTRVIQGSNTGFASASGLGGLAVDAAGELYVPEHNGSEACTPNGCTVDAGDTIAIFAPNANGNVAPVRTISSTACYSAASVAIASSANIEVACSEPSVDGSVEGDIVTFAPDASGNAIPLSVIHGPSRSFYAIAPSPLGMLFVSGQLPFLAVLGYPETASGNALPTTTLEPAGWYPAALAEDANATLYVLNAASPASVWEYGSNANGASSPMFVISGSNTGLPNCSSSSPCGVGGVAVGPP